MSCKKEKEDTSTWEKKVQTLHVWGYITIANATM
jgi:hypothetical protein